MDPGDKLTIETPEQIALEFPLAGIGSRFMAMLYDSLIQFVAVLALIVTTLIISPDLTRYWPDAWNWTAALLTLFFFLLYWGYFTVFETLWKGQTPGKRRAGIRVISESGRAITTFEAITRNLMRAIDSLPALYGVACISVFVDRRNRRLGDMVAGTVVVHDRKEEGVEPILDSAVTATSALAAANVAGKLSIAEFQLIEAFLARRLDLEPEVRRASAHQIAQRVTATLGAPAERPESDEDFLEAVVKQFRDTAHMRA